ncbi:MAG: DUF2029 domain-containing protein [Actinophytocola sp.]|nr:DUF2029 domain-containing protein [Actinophytocola sp.]
MCYSDVVPLYGAERLNRDDFFPYRDGWLELTTTEGDHVSATLRADGDRYRIDGFASGVEVADANGDVHQFAKDDVIGVAEDGDLLLGDGSELPLVAGDGVRFMEYPVLTGLFQWTTAKLTEAWSFGADKGVLPGGIAVAIYFNLTAMFLAFAWLVTVWAVARTARRRPWDAALVAISPLAVVHAFTNFDTLATALAVTALLAWSRKRPVVAGVLLGIGAALKLYPLFLLGPLLVLCLRAGKLRSFSVTAGTTLATAVAVNLPIFLAYPAGWWEFIRLNSERGMDPDSLYNVVRYFSGWAGFDGSLQPGETPVWLNTISGVLFLACCAGIAVIGLSAPVRPRLAQLCFLVVAAFLLTNKVWSPQYSLWLVPLAVLAIPRWRLLLGWMLLDAMVWAPRMFYYLGTDNKGLPEGWFLGTVVLRDLAVLGLCVLIIRNIYRPSSDPVREDGDDDPAGGVLNRARDVVVLGPRKPAGLPPPAVDWGGT